MGIIDFFNSLRVKPKSGFSIAKSPNNDYPIFSQFGQNIYASDVVQQAISCIVTEMKKITPLHQRDDGNDSIPVYGDVQRVLNIPNEIMTQSDFLEKVYWQLFLNYNAFIIPTYEGNKLVALYPIQPTNVTFLQDPTDKLFVEFQFANDYNTIVRYTDVIHLKYRYSVNELMGGNLYGQPDNDALLKTLDLNHTLLQGVSKVMKSSFAINGVVKYNTMLDDGKMDVAIEQLEKHLANNESGFLPLDMKGEFIPLKNNIQMVDSTTLKFIDEKILRHFGVPLPILTGDYTKSQYEAFYQKTLEPLIIAISQAFTKSLFTPTQIGFGNKIVFYPHELIFMDTNQKLEMVRMLGDSGSLFENEKRKAFGIQPLSELAGVRMQSLNYVNVEIASAYQLNSSKGEGEDVNAENT